MSIPRIAHEGQSTDLSALTVFRPALTTLILQTGSRAPTDELGVTTLTREWKCRRDLAESFLARRGDVDFQFRDLRLVDYVTRDEGAITTLTERYNGFIGGAREPVVISRRNRQIKEVSLRAKSPFEGALTLVYYSPSITRMWAAIDEPQIAGDPYLYTGPEFAGVKGWVKPIHFRNGNGDVLTGADTTAALMSRFDFKVQSIRTKFDPTPDGHVYRVTEVAERLITQPQLVDAEFINAFAG
ncbi:MAG: hypothetical protein ABMA13_18375 [Chthoniobacteraceae bacterium]